MAPETEQPNPPPQTTLVPLNADVPKKYQAYNKSARSRIASWIQMRLSEPGITNKEIAGRLGITPQTLNGIVSRARKEGWLTFEDPLSKLEYEIIPKAVENLTYWLDKKDKQATLETVKGTVFKQYQEAKGINEAGSTVLALKIEQPTGEGVKVAVGQIVGKPRLIEE